jgi:hypothetical protein
MSGWAVLAFVLSLVGFVVGLFWTWWPLAIPLAIGVGVLVLVPAGTRRGRVLAGWAIGLSLLAGSCSYTIHSMARTMLHDMANDVMSALSSKDGDAKSRDDALKRWVLKEAVEAGALARIRERFAKVEAEMGPYANEPIPKASVFSGTVAYMMAPANVEEIDPPRREDAGLVARPDAAFWFEVRFEKGVVYAAFELASAFKPDMKGGRTPGEGMPLLQDVRFFRPKAR